MTTEQRKSDGIHSRQYISEVSDLNLNRMILMKRSLIFPLMLMVVACQAPIQLTPDDEINVRMDRERARENLVPPGFQRLGGPSFGIVYNSTFREIHIYGRGDAENLAEVELFNISPVALPHVRVTLSSGTVVSGESDTLEMPLFSPFEAPAPTPTDPGGVISPTGEPGRAAPAPDPGVLVWEVYFHGGSQDDRFENRTSIPSHASGGHGNDTLIGGAGRDILHGGDGMDRLEGNDGNDDLHGGFDADDLIGGNGDDYLKEVATGNDNETNLLCGGNGKDYLEGAALASLNRLDGGVVGGENDGDVDTLIGTNIIGHNTDYEFHSPPDILIENGEIIEDNFPNSQLIPC